MASPTLIFTGSTGLNTRVDPVRIEYNSKTGIQELSAGVNVDIDDSLRLSRRKGFSVARSGEYHSLFPTELYIVAVKDDKLYCIYPDFTSIELRTVTKGALMSYMRLGDKVYYCNGHENGYVLKNLNYAWAASVNGLGYVGPTTQRTFSDPPIGHLLVYHGAKVYIAENNLVWESEKFAPHWFDTSQSHIEHASRITLLCKTVDGLYIGDEESIWSYVGSGADDFIVKQVTNYPAIEGTLCMIEGENIGSGDIFSGYIPVFTTTKGICIGGPEGQLLNISRNKISYPRARYGAALIKDNNYITLLKE